jgi:hypothetical protein
MIDRSLKILAAALVCTLSAQAQLATSLKLAKKDHLAGEAVLATVTVTNHSGRELIFQSDGRMQWLSFILKSSNGHPVASKGRTMFGPMKIGPGQSLAREVDLSQHFQLEQPGSYSVSAVIRPPGDNLQGSSTNQVFFNQTPGRTYWRQRVGVSSNASQTREYRLITFSGEQKNRIYAQVVDHPSGQIIRTFPLGDVLMLRKPVATIDNKRHLHAMFLATPTMWVHYVINSDAKVVDRQIHQRAAQGDPQLLTFPDGSVQVSNSIPYDPKAAAEERAKAHKASDRPQISQ